MYTHAAGIYVYVIEFCLMEVCYSDELSQIVDL